MRGSYLVRSFAIRFRPDVIVIPRLNLTAISHLAGDIGEIHPIIVIYRQGSWFVNDTTEIPQLVFEIIFVMTSLFLAFEEWSFIVSLHHQITNISMSCKITQNPLKMGKKLAIL